MDDVSNGAPSNLISVKDVYELVARLEGKVDTRLSAMETSFDSKFAILEAKVDANAARQDRLDGAVGLVKWLGPAGVLGLIYGIGKAAGYW